MTRISALVLLLSALLVAACGGETKEPNQSGDAGKQSATAKVTLEDQPSDSVAMKEAKNRFRNVCATCHGTTGQGDGAVAAAFPVKPRSYADQAWQASVTDEHLTRVILEGGAAVGKSPLMPPNPDLTEKKDVVAGLVALIRSYRK